MGYAGICSTNVQNNSDAYFGYVNIRDILDNVKNGVSASCAQITDFDNNPPTADAGQDYVIPKSTPFMLIGAATDRMAMPLLTTGKKTTLKTRTRLQHTNANARSGCRRRSLNASTSNVRLIRHAHRLQRRAVSTPGEANPSVARTLNAVDRSRQPRWWRTNGIRPCKADCFWNAGRF
jgi:hypothetical protein